LVNKKNIRVFGACLDNQYFERIVLQEIIQKKVSYLVRTPQTAGTPNTEYAHFYEEALLHSKEFAHPLKESVP